MACPCFKFCIFDDALAKAKHVCNSRKKLYSMTLARTVFPVCKKSESTKSHTKQYPPYCNIRMTLYNDLFFVGNNILRGRLVWGTGWDWTGLCSIRPNNPCLEKTRIAINEIMQSPKIEKRGPTPSCIAAPKSTVLWKPLSLTRLFFASQLSPLPSLPPSYPSPHSLSPGFCCIRHLKFTAVLLHRSQLCLF